MKFTELWQQGAKATLSFELFPARTDKGQVKLLKVIDELSTLAPDFFSVTFGAGGATRQGSYELVRNLTRDRQQQVLAYFAGYGLGFSEIGQVLDAYQELGLANLLVVRGDPPREQPDFTPHPQSMAHASDLLLHIRQRYPFCLGAAGYPEGHIEAESKEKDLEYLKLKVECGAAFIVANYFYDNQLFFDFLVRCRASGIEVPIIAGVMPIYSLKMTENLAQLCGASIPGPLREQLSALPPDDKAAVERFGIDWATRQCEELLRSGVAGIHLYTMDRSRTAMEVVRRLRENKLLAL